ncbi:hypothetical protein BaRGS_00009915 [Batillaria attramentaria]|uniref:Uncharacterized protein n=1 Tax=Batillaria attramentaria TaxID=370345 RepID=A0ABD0LI26_9CAEN
MTQADHQPSCVVKQKVEKLGWDTNKAQLYLDALRSRETYEKLTRATSDTDVDINRAVGLLVERLQSAADCMKKEVTITSQNRGAEWFDVECVQAKKTSIQMSHTRQCFAEARHQYQKLIREKKGRYCTKTQKQKF